MRVAAGLLWIVLAAPPEAEVAAALARVRAADRYQTELPGARGAVTEVRSDVPRGTRTERTRTRVHTPNLLPLWQILLWLVAIVLTAALAVWILRELEARRRAKAAVGSRGSEAAPAAAATRPRLPDHEALARAGEYGEAVHAILVTVLAAVGRAGPGLPPAWTSREVLAAVKVGGPAHEALKSLVRLVEITRFGGAPATEADYRRARDWLAALVSRRAA